MFLPTSTQIICILAFLSYVAGKSSFCLGNESQAFGSKMKSKNRLAVLFYGSFKQLNAEYFYNAFVALKKLHIQIGLPISDHCGFTLTSMP